ncbi:MAG: alpha-glucosidase/alpha-galactosidase [Ruminococcus sp.]|nr:alpha-glucosidase/alpha-galactosidase [Ruminococcus sp.]
MNGERLNIAYIGGGSCNFGWKLIPALADEDLCAMIKLYDTDKTCTLANEVIGNSIHDKGSSRGDIIYLACDTAEEALRNADFVILSFDPGSHEELVTELHLPETYGIYQTDPNNCGPGALIRALKIMPLCADYARLIEKLCPDAWVISLSSPMAECITVLKDTFPQIKLCGASEDSIACRDLLAAMLCEDEGVTGIRRRDIKTNIIGICGFSWFNEAIWNGKDLFPMFAENARKFADSGYEHRINEYKTNPESDAHKIKFDLFLRYGLISAVNDRRAAAACPPWYCRSPKEMNYWKFSPMTVGYKKKIFAEKTSRVKKYMNGEPLPKSLGALEVPGIIRALCGGGNLILPVMLPNSGQVENLPAGTVTETNALISKSSIRPVLSGSLPPDILALTMRHVYNRSAIVKAYKNRDLDIAFNAFLNDPAMICGLAEATELYREMLSAVRTHLIYYCE